MTTTIGMANFRIQWGRPAEPATSAVQQRTSGQSRKTPLRPDRQFRTARARRSRATADRRPENRRNMADLRNRPRSSSPLPGLLKSLVHHLLCLVQDFREMTGISETLGVDLVDILGAGRTGGKPAHSRRNLESANGSVVARCGCQLGENAIASQLFLSHRFGGQLLQYRLLFRSCRHINPRIVGRAKFGCDFAIVFAWIFSRSRRYFRRQQIHYWAVLVRGPGCAVDARETGARALFTAEAIRAIDQAGNKPLESHRHFTQLSSELADHAVDDAAADKSLADCGMLRPLRTMRKQIANRNRQIMIWIH